MSQTKHTPGPWRIERATPKKYKGQVWVYGAVPAYHIINCTGVTGEDEKSVEANARLIAAAPELLEACKEALAVLTKHDNPYAQIHAAIAKAEGRA